MVGVIEAHEIFSQAMCEDDNKTAPGCGLYQGHYNQLMASQTGLFMSDAQIAHK